MSDTTKILKLIKNISKDNPELGNILKETNDAYNNKEITKEEYQNILSDNSIVSEISDDMDDLSLEINIKSFYNQIVSLVNELS